MPTTANQKVGKYILKNELGKGAFGTVFRAIDSTTQKEYAVKRLERKMMRSPTMKALFDTEVSIMHDIEHPNILHLYAYLESAEYYYLVINYCNQGDFEQYMKRRGKKFLEEGEAKAFLKQIMNGFSALRKAKILHRDFKLANIFLHNDVLIIGDFGLAKKGVEITKTKLGTPLTMAPELMFGSDESSYTSKADLWSIGCVYYEMLFGDSPFDGGTMEELKAAVLKSKTTPIRFPRQISEDSKDLIRKLLTFDASRRIDWADFFNHPLFRVEAAPKPVANQLGSIFAAIGTLAAHTANVDQEFFNNQKDVNLKKDVDFIPESALVQFRNVFQPDKIEDQSLNSLSGNHNSTALNQSMDLESIKKHYEHEHAKITFFEYTARTALGLLQNQYYQPLYAPLFNIAILIYKKASVMNQVILQNIQNRNNFLNEENTMFNYFASSPMSNEVSGIFNNEAYTIEGLNQSLQQVQGNFGLVVQNPDIVYSQNPNFQSIDDALYRLSQDLKNYTFALNDYSMQYYKQELVRMLVCVRDTIQSQAVFPYVPNMAFPQFKFNWLEHYRSLEAASYTDLMQRL